MRRNSPPRFSRRNSPPRRGGRPRSLTPPSRIQPPPPGEERSRKINPWDAQNPHKRPRSRSRSRERLVRAREGERRGRIDREPPVIPMVDEQARGRFVRGREPPRDVLRKGDERLVRSRESHRERERALHGSRMLDTTEVKLKNTHKRHSLEHNKEQNDGFEENYLDQQKNNFENSGVFPNEEPILDPSSITFNAYPLENPRDNSRDSRRPPLHPNPNNSFGKHDKEENAADRINRLEKLVEKLVEGNVKPTKSKNYPKSDDVVPELIPSSSKFTTSLWINRIHEECLHRNYDEKSSIRYMKDNMTGIMKAWFKSVSNYDFTWPELKLLLIKTFPDNIEFAQTLKLLVARDKTADETITQYYFSKVYLCEACKITGENSVSCLIDGLTNPFMKQDIRSYNFLTPEALYSEYLSKFPEHDVPVRVEHREVRIENREEPGYHIEDFIPLEIEDRGRDYHMPSKGPSARGERFGKHLAERPMERPKCFTCNKLGHLTIDCRHAPICYNCKKKGHIAAKCHFNNVLLISSTHETLKKAPVVVCEVNGKKFDGVIDTGSMTVTMKKSVAKYLKLHLKKTKEVLKGFGGSIITALGETEIFLTVDSTHRLTKVLVVDDIDQDDPVIVGQEFLTNNVSVFIQNGDVYIIDTGSNGIAK